MEPQQNNNTVTGKYVAIGIGTFLIGAGIMLFADPYLPTQVSNSAKGYQAGFNAAKMLVEKSSIGALLGATSTVRVLSGTVTAVNGEQLVLRVDSKNPFDDPALAFRTVLIGPSTTVVKLVLKDAKTYQAEMASYTKAQIPGKTVLSPPTIPSPFVQTPASATDIIVGDTVTVGASENVKTLEQFTATSIQIAPKTSAPTTL
ncbi:MAG: hypothetical protein Q7R90_00180 [bacterium]|nr:hypothetical protein [bacterium]